MQINVWTVSSLIFFASSAFCAASSSSSIVNLKNTRENNHIAIRDPAEVAQKRASDPEVHKRWVFFVSDGYGNDPTLGDIEKYLVSNAEADAKNIKRKPYNVVDYKNNVTWFYAETSKNTAEYIRRKWNQTISDIALFDTFKLPVLPGFDSMPTPVSIKKDQPLHVKRRLSKRGTRRELCVLSQNPGTQLEDPCEYVTEASQGEGVEVYLVGTGANLDHDEFKHLKPESVEWILADRQNNNEKDDRYDVNGENVLKGTAILSKLCGIRDGVAQHVTPIIVKVSNEKGEIHSLNIIEGLQNAYRSIVSKDDSAQFIVINSVDIVDISEGAMGGRIVINAYIKAIQMLSRKDNVIMLTAAEVKAGSRAVGQTRTHAYPGILGLEEKYYPNLKVVGGVDQELKVTNDVGAWVRAYTPVYDIEAAGKPPSDYVTWARGVFFGSSDLPIKELLGITSRPPTVAGILATFMRKSRISVREAFDQLDLFAYPRGPTKLHRRVVYNAVWQDPTANSPPPGPGSPDMKADDAERCGRCKEAAGKESIDGVLWIPEDCPCRTETRIGTQEQ
ncbi:hypothetical protein TWF730_007416 [Orbilia blumenaviensis]|uniref:Uncharacterized protein n=1 Tax=Orbilia blumenaviensis TaxID=1796055 RepID=A0AAV9VAA7_9PEZI